MSQKQAENVEPGAAIVYNHTDGGRGAVLVKTVNPDVAQERCLGSRRIEVMDVWGDSWEVKISTLQEPHEVSHVRMLSRNGEDGVINVTLDSPAFEVVGISNCRRGVCRVV